MKEEFGAQRCLKQAQLGSSKIEADRREGKREEHLSGLVWTAALSKYCKGRLFNFCATVRMDYKGKIHPS